MGINIPNNWEPRPYQSPVWDYLEDGGLRAVEIAHRRWGKDDVALHNAACQALQRQATYWHCLPEYAQARKAIWNAVDPHTGKRRIDMAFPREIRARTNDQEMFIEFVNGSTWQVIGSDRYDSLVGAGVAGVTFSEWALANPAAWGYISPMMRENNGWAFFITTPRGRNHAHTLYEYAKTQKDWFAQVSSIADTGALSEDDQAEALREYTALYGPDLGEAKFQQEYLCSWDAAIPGAYWANLINTAESEGRICSVDPDPALPVHTAWDLGVSDSTVIWFFQIVPRDGGEAGVHVVDYHEATGEGLEYYKRVLDGKRYNYGEHFAPHDANAREWGSGRTRIETARSLGLVLRLVPQHRVNDGINAVRVILPRVRFDAERCRQGIEALRQYRTEWDDKKLTFRDAPLHDWASHAADAFRYLAMGFREIVPPKARPAPQFGAHTFNDLLALSRKRRLNDGY